MAMSVTGSIAPVAGGNVEEEQAAIEKVILTAKKRREDLVVVRLCDAAHKGNVEKMQRLLSSNRVDVNKGDYDKRRPIHLAACGGHVRVIELLIVAQADINVKDRYQGTPLADALRHQQTEAADMLRMYGGVRESAGVAEHLAFCAANPARVEELVVLTRDKTSFAPDNFDARTALHIASAVGNEEGVRVLIRSRADVNATDRRGRTPLQDAFFGKRDKCGRVLLENGHCLLDEVDPDELHLLGLSMRLACGDGGNSLPCPSHLVCKLLVLLRCLEQPLLLLRPLLFPAGCYGRGSLHFMNWTFLARA
jgi:hypothetical protein